MLGIIGDLHLGPKELETVYPKLYLKQLETLDKIVEIYRFKGCSEFFFLGDIFDVATPEMEIQESFIYWLQEKVKQGNSFHAILGNHDFDSTNVNSLRTLNFINTLIQSQLITIYYEPTVESFADCNIFICPHPFIEDVPKGCKYGFGHFAYSGAKGDNGFKVLTKHTPKGRWILGDFHTPQSGNNYTYVGSVTQIKFNESSKKRTLLLDEGEITSVAHKPTFTLSKITVSSDKDFEQINPDYLYSVSFSPDYVTKINWQKKYKNILKVSVTGTKNKKAQVLIQSLKEDNPLSGLDDYLENKIGLSKKQIKKAYSLIGASYANI